MVLQLPTEMFQIQSCLPYSLQGTGIGETKAGGGMLQRLYADHERRSLHSSLLEGLPPRYLHRARRLQMRVGIRRPVMRLHVPGE